MRVLWVDADEMPWTDPNGWRVVEDFGLAIERFPSVEAARAAIARKQYELLLVRAELDGATELLRGIRAAGNGDPRRNVLASSTWSKADFKSHSKTEGAAHRYARVPMPPEGFLGLVADLFGCSVEELGEFTLPDGDAFSADELRGGAAPSAGPKTFSVFPDGAPAGDSSAAAAEPAPAAKPARRANSAAAGEDVEVLRRYLRIKEEQLDISEGERRQLSLENERLQKEAHQLQLRLRELTHLEDELTKKLSQMEEERRLAEVAEQRAAEERERNARNQGEVLRGLEQKLRDADQKYDDLRVRVKKDLRKIRENERDLEARLELLRKDSETLLRARDERVLELQRQIDALEFDLDQVQDGKVQAQLEAERYLAKLARVARALQLATGMIEDEPVSDEDLAALEPLVGGAATAEEPAVPAPIAEAAPAADDANLPATTEEEPVDLDALAQEGEPTQMIQAGDFGSTEGEPESSSG